MREIKRIIVHHTATPQTTTVESIRGYHMNSLGWRDIGYHYLIAQDMIRLGRPVHIQGAHCSGNNEDSIGVAVIGDYRYGKDDFDSGTLAILLEDLCRQYPGVRIFGHKELANTLCPGEQIMDWLKAWRAE